jgi:hypothetical protein
VQSSPSKRLIGKPFQKGRSGNPAGRPKGSGTAEIKALLRPHDRLLVQKLKDLLSHEEGKVQMEALKLAFAYRWGKPTEQVPTDGESSESEWEAESMTEDEIKRLQWIATGGKPEDYRSEDHAVSAGPPPPSPSPIAPAKWSTTPTPPPPLSPPSGAPSKDDPLQGCTPDERRTAVLAAVGYLPP